MNLLFSCAGRRAYLLKYFRAALDAVGGGKIFATDMSLTAPALAFADVALRVPAVYAEDYTRVVEEICRENKIDALISLNDLELPILAAARERFEKIGTRLIISSPEVIDICFDKLKTARFAESLGLNTPKTFVVLQDALSALDNGELVFPLILKPRWGSGSIGIEFVRDREELLETYEIVRRKVARSILSTASAREEEILIQQAITDAEYGLDVMNDLDGNTVAVSVKRKLAMRAGETDKAVTADNAEIREIGFKLGKALRHVANLDCDVLERDGRYYVLELNPRFGGGYPFSQEAGVNLPLAILKWLRGENVGAELLTAKPNVAFAKCDILTEIPPPSNRRLRRSGAFPVASRRGNAASNFGKRNRSTLQICEKFVDGFEALRLICSGFLFSNQAIYFLHRGDGFRVGDFRASDVRCEGKRAVVHALMQEQAHCFGHRNAELREKFFRLQFNFGFDADAERCGFCHDNAFRFGFCRLPDNKNTNAIHFTYNERSAA